MSENVGATTVGRPVDRIDGWTETSGVSLRYVLSGNGGPSVVLIHELGGTLDSWTGVLGALEPHCAVLRFDQRGHGLSEKVREPFTLDDQVDDLEAVLGAAQPSGPYWLVGAAAGAAVAVKFATRHPQDVVGIVMCAPALNADPSRSTYLQSRSALAATRGMRAIADASLERSYPEAIRDAAVYRDYRARFLANDPVSYGLANHALSDVELRDELAALRCACLVLAGRFDLLRPPALIEVQAALLANARFVAIDCAHLMPVQAPVELASYILDFVRRRQ
jgi:3-oxoadipate enol-lactonase